MDVQVLRSAVHAVCCIAVITSVPGTSAILVHVNGNMWAESTEPLLDVPCLLTRKLRVITVWVEVGTERALEVRIPIWIICSVSAISLPWTALFAYNAAKQ